MLVVLSICGPIVIWNAYDPAVYWEDVVNVYIPSHDEYRTGIVSGEWIPFYARWNPKILFSKNVLLKPQIIFGSPTQDLIYVFHENDERGMAVILHVFDNMVRGVKILYTNQMKNSAQSIRKNILADHPRMPVLMKENIVEDGVSSFDMLGVDEKYIDVIRNHKKEMNDQPPNGGWSKDQNDQTEDMQ